MRKKETNEEEKQRFLACEKAEQMGRRRSNVRNDKCVGAGCEKKDKKISERGEKRRGEDQMDRRDNREAASTTERQNIP